MSVSLFSFKFKNKNLFKNALTHRSYLNEHKQKNLISNERLEFLGDAVLELIVTFYLYQKYPNTPEGELTTLRATLVQTQTLNLAAERINLGDRLRLSKGEKASGGNKNPSILADTFEAVIGAIYIDAGFDKAYQFTCENLLVPAEKLFAHRLPKDYKSNIQELVQSSGLLSPIYKVIKESGLDHDKIFVVAIIINKKKVTTGSGKSKQKAEQKAAKKALKLLKKQKNLSF